MSTIRIGDLIPIRWSEFANNSASTVRVYYRVGEQTPVALDPLDNSYATAVDGNADGLNRHSANIVATEGMLGSSVVILIVDATEDDISIEATEEPHDICTADATSVSVSPSAASVPINLYLTFTAVFYAADGLPTDAPVGALWSVDAGAGSINANTGRLAAADTPGGPFTVTVEAGGVSDTAQVTIVAARPMAGPRSVMSQGFRFSFA